MRRQSSSNSRPSASSAVPVIQEADQSSSRKPISINSLKGHNNSASHHFKNSVRLLIPELDGSKPIRLRLQPPHHRSRLSLAATFRRCRSQAGLQRDKLFQDRRIVHPLVIAHLLPHALDRCNTTTTVSATETHRPTVPRYITGYPVRNRGRHLG